MLNELVAMFRRLDDEKVAWNAYRTLDYAQAEYIKQVPTVLADDGCDHADGVSKYAITANEALACAIVNHHLQIVKDDTQQLLNRRSSRFRAVIAEYHSENPQEDFAAIETADDLLGHVIYPDQYAIFSQSSCHSEDKCAGQVAT